MDRGRESKGSDVVLSLMVLCVFINSLLSRGLMPFASQTPPHINVEYVAISGSYV